MEQSLTIYKASAGSGKTFTLAVEYIIGLLELHAEKEFEHTLAVTFTNKATAEMKSRILETLYGLKMGLEETKPYMDAILKTLSNSPIKEKDPSQPPLKGEELTVVELCFSPFKGELERVLYIAPQIIKVCRYQ